MHQFTVTADQQQAAVMHWL